MAFTGFFEKSKSPTDKDLAEALGPAIGLWHELRRLIAQQFVPLTEEWVFGGKNYGWSLRLKQKKRAVLYMKPLPGYFLASFAFGEKAVQAAHQGDLPASVLKTIDDAPKYPEGRAVRMEVKSARDVRAVLKLAAIKMAN
ncbi:MAG: DUF3788 domain-containing protein [Candidatus Aminicenantes bacterium]|nr:DUF3788 domain-containing protein [Candidatus Aminicenantes bacterium]